MARRHAWDNQISHWIKKTLVIKNFRKKINTPIKSISSYCDFYKVPKLKSSMMVGHSETSTKTYHEHRKKKKKDDRPP